MLTLGQQTLGERILHQCKQYKNVKTKELIQKQEFYGKQFLIKRLTY